MKPKLKNSLSLPLTRWTHPRAIRKSRSSYYSWLSAEETRASREAKDRADFEPILSAYLEGGRKKVAKAIHMTLLHRPEPVVMNLKKIRRLMKKYGLECPIREVNPYQRMAKALKTNNVADKTTWCSASLSSTNRI